MTRIPSPFNLLKRVGFALLLLGAGLVSQVNAQGWSQFELFTADSLRFKQAEVATDSFGNLHVFYIQERRNTSGIGFEHILKFVYLSVYGDIILGPISLSPNIENPEASIGHVVGDGLSNSWCVWSDSMAAPSGEKGLFLAQFDASTQILTGPLLLGESSQGDYVPSISTDLTYRSSDQTLHLVDAGFFSQSYSRFTTSGEVLDWLQPVDSAFLSEYVSATTMPSGEIWAVFRNEVPGGAEALFVRFNEDQSQTILRPFGAAPDVWSSATSLVGTPDGNFHCCAWVPSSDMRYCRLDSALNVLDWHDLRVNDAVAKPAFISNDSGNVFVTWSETTSFPRNAAIYCSRYGPATGWFSDGELIATGLKYVFYLDPIQMPNGAWAIVACAEPQGGPEGESDLYLYTFGVPDDASPEISPLVSNLEVSAFPNPFNSTTTVRLNLPIGTRNVKLTVTNVLGQTVEQREIEVLAPRVEIQLSLDNWPSGIYFAQAQALNKTQTTKLVLLK